MSAKADLLGTSATVKLTVSVKRRLGNGDEVFFAPGMELVVTPEEFAAAKEQVTNTLEAWVAELTEKFPDPADAEDDAQDTDDGDDEDDDDDDEGEELTEDEIKAMSKKDLLALIKEQELEIDGAAKMTVKELREAVFEALAGDEDDDDDDDDSDEDSDDDDDDEDDDDDDDDSDEDSDDDDDDEDDEEGDDEPYTEAELKAMKLSELQEIADSWALKHPKLDKAAKVKEKIAAYVKLILKNQD